VLEYSVSIEKIKEIADSREGESDKILEIIEMPFCDPICS
jgi:hypothetical protein